MLLKFFWICLARFFLIYFGNIARAIKTIFLFSKIGWEQDFWVWLWGILLFFHEISNKSKWQYVSQMNKIVENVVWCLKIQKWTSYLVSTMWSLEDWITVIFLIIAQFEALNKRISKWAYFLKLGKQFQRYLHFSAQKRGFFGQVSKGNFILGLAPKNKIFDVFL